MTDKEIKDAPMTTQVYQALCQQIQQMSPGIPLPPVPELMEQLGVGRLTLDKVYALLEQQGFIERKRRKGVFVADRIQTGEIAMVMSEACLAPGNTQSCPQQCRLRREKLHEVIPNCTVKRHLETDAIPDAPLTTQAYQTLRQQIQLMSPGVPLPPILELMEQLGVGRLTLDKVYALLERQGYIERKRRKGVFVADRIQTGEIAIVLSEAFLAPGASQAYAQQCRLLRHELHEATPNWTVKLHLGPGTIPGYEIPENLDLLEPTVLPRLRGVLSFIGLFEVEAKLQEAGVPVVYLGASRDKNPGVLFDMDQFLRDGIRHLAECGCRTVTMLHTRYIGKKPLEKSHVPVAATAAAECGLEFRDEWLGYGEGGWGERLGYDLFLRVWNQGEHPDGILVTDDILCHGVLRAIQEQQICLPRDLRLLTYANRGFDFPYPQSVTRIAFDLDDCAVRAVRMLEKLAQGKPLENPVENVRGTFVKGETT